MAFDKNGKLLPKGITQRSDGLYMGRFTYHGERNCVYDNTLKGVTKKLDDLRYEMQHGTYAKSQNLSLNSWFDTWLEDYKRDTIKTNTYNSYRNQYNYYIKKKLGKKMIADIRVEHIQKLYKDFVNQDFATGSIKLISAMLNGCFKQAQKNDIITKNPVALANLPKGKEKKNHEVFTSEHQDIFLQYAKNSYLFDFFSLALMTGMRNGELRGLQWSDIDFKSEIIHVNHTLVYSKEKGHFLNSPKTKSSKRDIPMIKPCYDLLFSLYKFSQANKIVVMNRNDFIFALDNGEVLTRDRVTLELNTIIESMKANNITIGHITCHSLRHSFATRAIEQGMPPQVLKTILGHSSLSMTMDLYSHVLPNTQKEEMKKIANLF